MRPLAVLETPLDDFEAFSRHVNPALAAFLRLTGDNAQPASVAPSTADIV